MEDQVLDFEIKENIGILLESDSLRNCVSYGRIVFFDIKSGFQ